MRRERGSSWLSRKDTEAPDPCDRLHDLEVYSRLVEITGELTQMSNRCWSISSKAALAASASMVRVVASGVYHRSLEDPASE